MVSRGATQRSSAPYNRRIVLDVIRRYGSASRKEIVDLLDPQAIVIGGSAPRVLVERIVALAQPLLRSVRGGTAAQRVVLSQRQEDSSTLGAAVLPIYEMLSPRFEVLLTERRPEEKIEGLLGRKPMSRAGRL